MLYGILESSAAYSFTRSCFLSLNHTDPLAQPVYCKDCYKHITPSENVQDNTADRTPAAKATGYE